MLLIQITFANIFIVTLTPLCLINAEVIHQIKQLQNATCLASFLVTPRTTPLMWVLSLQTGATDLLIDSIVSSYVTHRSSIFIPITHFEFGSFLANF